MQSARRIDNHRIETVTLGILDTLFWNFNGITLSFFKHFDADFTADGLQLFYPSRSVNVAGDQQRLFTLFFKIQRKFAAERRLAGALQTAHHYNRRQRRRHDELAVRRTHQRGKFFVDDFNYLLCRRKTFKNLLPNGFLAYLGDEIFCNGKIDVRLEQRYSHFAHRLFYLEFGKFAAFREFWKYMIKFFG